MFNCRSRMKKNPHANIKMETVKGTREAMMRTRRILAVGFDVLGGLDKDMNG